MSSIIYPFSKIPSPSTLSQFTMQPQIPPSKTSYKVAVIGAGAAGLVAARELRREGHQVVVFERNSTIGGTWVYDMATDSDPLGADPSRTIVHTSLYDSLRTNLPRELMGISDYPFVARDGKHRDSRRFPGHREVFHYLEDFTREFELGELIRFETQVIHVGLLNEEEQQVGKWLVRSTGKDSNVEDDEVYNAVVVCNGHYSVPHNVAKIPGIEVWPGKQIHSHNYRVPDPFYKKVVVLIGSSSSAFDISRDISRVAKEVHVASRSIASETPPTKAMGYNNLWMHSMIKSTHEDGTVVFQDGKSVIADVILHCTGYKYNFPFLETTNIVTVDDNRVGPLYKHVFPPRLAPWLSFVGIPLKAVAIPLCELQSKWVAGILSGQISLPSQQEMMSDVEAFYAKLEAAGIPKRYTHNIASCQYEYNDWLAAQCRCAPTEEWRKQMYAATIKNRAIGPETYRDQWNDHNWLLQAQKDFLQYKSKGLLPKQYH